jgi:cytochrome c-type biogenesis protein CcmF
MWEANPNNFKPGQIPPDGAGLNPLLIDPWMVVHPPVLFLGYASASIPFAYAIVALITKDYQSWIDRSYKWLLFSLTTLGIGIFLGGYWAYTVLGWGGYWGWDPVENSSLIPWLVGVILLHGIIIQRRKKALVKTNLFFALTYLILVFYSTYLTRSGVLSDFSVHSFGNSLIGMYLLGFIFLCIIVSSYLLFKDYRDITGKPLNTNEWGWDTFTVYGILTLTIYTLLILVGTSMPIISGILMSKATAVTTDFYNNLSIPFVLIILVLMILATLSIISKKLINNIAIIIALFSIIIAVFFNISYTNNIIALGFTAVSFFVLFQYIRDLLEIKKSSILASRLSHIGLAVMIIGVITSNFHSSKIQKKIFMGREAAVGPVSLTFNGFTREKKSSVLLTMKEGEVSKNISSKYFVNEQSNSLYREPYIRYGFFEDIYVIPEKYEPGKRSNDKPQSVIIAKGEQKAVGGLKVKFLNFDTRKMAAADPVIYANLLINGKRVSPGKKINRQQGKNTIDVVIPGTNRSVSLVRINPSRQMIDLFISPDSNAVNASQPASLIINVSEKRLIWIVWLGTILITIGGFIGFFKFRESKSETLMEKLLD